MKKVILTLLTVVAVQKSDIFFEQSPEEKLLEKGEI